MSDFMEWAEGDDFITEDDDVRDSCEGAWDAAWALQGHRIAELKADMAELKKAYNEMISQSQDQILELQAENAKLREALVQYRVAMEFTRQYVGYKALPPIKGWSWYDADENAKAALQEKGE